MIINIKCKDQDIIQSTLKANIRENNRLLPFDSAWSWQDVDISEGHEHQMTKKAKSHKSHLREVVEALNPRLAFYAHGKPGPHACVVALLVLIANLTQPIIT